MAKHHCLEYGTLSQSPIIIFFSELSQPIPNDSAPHRGIVRMSAHPPVRTVYREQIAGSKDCSAFETKADEA